MENIGIIFPAIMMIALGIVIGMYVSSQIKYHIRRNINKNNLERYENEQKKRKN